LGAVKEDSLQKKGIKDVINPAQEGGEKGRIWPEEAETHYKDHRGKIKRKSGQVPHL